MKLATGTKLGPYQIEHAIGAGGMGVVYRADDSRLGRKVAIKVLPHATGEYFRRFEREARTIGGLNHPNLLTLYDVGEHDGTPYLVTEMLDGESLRARLSRGKLPLRQAVQIAADVARGLAAAHDAGVVHRDVKPDNIFLTTEGFTKILDFGIAKLRRATEEMPAVDIAQMPTITPTTKDTGVVIGTPGYMAPEQLDAGAVDERTDIFALGVVLYEMISGHRAFASDSPVEESYAILKATPEPPKGATKAVARVVMRCLEKRPDARFQSARDLAFALDELDASTDPIARISRIGSEHDVGAAPTLRDARPARPQPSPRRWLAVGLLAVTVALLAGVLIGRRGRPAGVTTSWPSLVEGGPEYRRVTYHPESAWDARLTPDGTAVVYSTLRAGRLEVVRSELAHPTILPTHIEGRLLDVSRRGELAVLTASDERERYAAGTLARVFEGAGARAVADHVTAAAWLPDGETLAIVRDGASIELPIGTEIVHRATNHLNLLRASASGDRLAYVEHPGVGETSGRVVVIDLKGVEHVRSSHHVDIEGLVWAPDGRGVWFSDGPTIYGLDASGTERVVLRGPVWLTLADSAGGKVLVSANDPRIKLFTGPRAGPFHEVSWFDSSAVLATSIEGTKILFHEASGTGQTDDGYATFVRQGDTPAALIGHAFTATLLPDASALIAIASPTKLQEIPTGTGLPKSLALGRIAKLEIGDFPAVSWSGRYLVVRGAEANGAMRLWRIDRDHPVPEPVGPDAVNSRRHPISPDGSVIAIKRAAGGIELLGAAPRSFEGPVGEQPLSFTGDGTALFAMHLDGGAIAVDRIEIATGERTPWTRITPEQQPVYYSVVLSADGGVVTYSTNSDASDLYVLEPPAGR